MNEDVYELTELELDEVSLVDSPANKGATVALFKRETPMNEDETKMEEQVETVAKADFDALAAEKAELEAKIETLKAELVAKEEVEKAAKEEFIDFEGERVNKAAIPAPVLKKLEDMQKAAEKEELRKRAREVLPNFKGTEDQRGALLKSIEGLDDEAALLEALKAADALFAAMFGEIGKKATADDLKNPEERLNDLAKEFAKSKGITPEKAYIEVLKTEEGKKLYKLSKENK